MSISISIIVVGYHDGCETAFTNQQFDLGDHAKEYDKGYSKGFSTCENGSIG